MIRLSQLLSTISSILVNRLHAIYTSIQSELRSRRCPLCKIKHTDTIVFCAACFNDLPWNRSPCIKCALPMESSGTVLCGECISENHAYDLVLAPFVFDFPIDESVKRFKYHGRTDYGNALVGALSTYVTEHYATHHSSHEASEPVLPDLIVPVPRDPQRSKGNTIDQTHYLSTKLAHALGLRQSGAIIHKVHSTPRQAGLTKSKRRSNLSSAFGLRQTDTTQLPAHIALIDDVMTTGSTAEAIAKTLKEGGAKRVDIWVVARTSKQ